MKNTLTLDFCFYFIWPFHMSFQEFHEVPFLKKFKFKGQDRVYPKEAPAQTLKPAKAETLASASSAPSEQLLEAAPSGQGKLNICFRTLWAPDFKYLMSSHLLWHGKVFTTLWTFSYFVFNEYFYNVGEHKRSLKWNEMMHGVQFWERNCC